MDRFPEDVTRLLQSNGYSISKKLLGSGAYSKVYEGQEDSTKTKVAIKLINKKTANIRFLYHFLPRELDIISRIHHPNINRTLKIFSQHNQGTHIVIISELAARVDLHHSIQYRGALQEGNSNRSPAQILFRQLLEAVNHLHKNHIVHRDLKCENVLLDARGNVKLGDFGFARYMRPVDTSETFCGSSAYAAPEILENRRYNGIPVDMWSLGIILYVVLHGFMPFDDSRLSRMLVEQKKKQLSFLPNGVSKAAQNLIHGLLEPDIKQRFTYQDCNKSQWLKNTNLEQL